MAPATLRIRIMRCGDGRQTLAESAHIAGEFVRHAMESTQFQPNHTERGVSFELNLDELTRLVRR